MALCPRCGTQHPRGTPCPEDVQPYDEYELLEAYDDFMENQEPDALTEEEEARKDGGSYKTFLGFFLAFGVFVLLAVVVAVLA